MRPRCASNARGEKLLDRGEFDKIVTSMRRKLCNALTDPRRVMPADAV